MAYTFTNVTKTVFGNQEVQMGLLSADAASGTVSFGLGVLTGVSYCIQSASTNSSALLGRWRLNQTAAGTASVGDLGVSGATAGDEFLVVVYGR